MLFIILSWVLLGLGAGVVARQLRPGPDAMGMTGTVLLGITGSLLGGGFTSIVGYGTSPTQAAGWIMSLVGALVLLSAASLSGMARRIL
jgi:uncharacterized membrane protein YeaQ/YmgE (transglycosylase-associated protein family)